MPLSKTEVMTMMVVQEIHDQIDEDLLRDLGTWLNARPQMRSVSVAATLAYFVSDALADCCQTQKEVCTFGQAYGDYIHQTAHYIFDHPGDDKTKAH